MIMERKIDLPPKKQYPYQVITDLGMQTEVLATTETEALTKAMNKHHLDENYEITEQDNKYTNDAKVTHKFKSKWFKLRRKGNK